MRLTWCFASSDCLVSRCYADQTGRRGSSSRTAVVQFLISLGLEDVLLHATVGVSSAGPLATTTSNTEPEPNSPEWHARETENLGLETSECNSFREVARLLIGLRATTGVGTAQSLQ